jgi:uncharacterized protein DUF4124
VKTTRWVLFSALLATLAAHGAEVYRSKDANGVVSYSDRPDSDNSQAVYVATPRAGRPGNTVAPRQAAKPAADDKAAREGEQAGQRERVEQTPAEQAAMRSKNCQTARERQGKYAVSHRLFRELPNGERAYLNDAEIDEAKAKAAADVKTWCD